MSPDGKRGEREREREIELDTLPTPNMRLIGNVRG